MLLTEKHRIISLLPAATEMVSLLGHEQSLVGRSHDSDYPAALRHIPIVSSTIINEAMTSREIDTAVKEAQHRGSSIFHINRKQLAGLSPTLILTQELCPVCAPSLGSVEEIASSIGSDAQLLSLAPHTLEDIFGNIREVAAALECENMGEKVVAALRQRLEAVSTAVSLAQIRSSVLVLEWLDPLMVAAHWVPEMVAVAGGRMLFSKSGEHSQTIAWEEITRLNPEFLILAPCGFSIERAAHEIEALIHQSGFTELSAYAHKQIFYVDGNVYLTRPGPRIVDGVEILAELLHPTLISRDYPETAWRRLVT